MTFTITLSFVQKEDQSEKQKVRQSKQKTVLHRKNIPCNAIFSQHLNITHSVDLHSSKWADIRRTRERNNEVALEES